MEKAKDMKKLLTLAILLSLSSNTWSTTGATQLPNSATKLPAEPTQVESNANIVRVDKKNPYSMIKEVADLTFKRFANEQEDIRNNPNLLKNIVREELMPYVNYQYAAFKVIGSNFKKTNKAERAAFVPVFREYLVTSYAQVFTLYDNQIVNFHPEKDFAKDKVVAVKISVIESGRDPIDISFRVRINKKTKDWKAYDMVAEGISLLDSKQAELSSLIRQKGLPHVTEMLKAKSTKNIVFK
jgi:phospholipid transport system substrate-binding protein